MKTRPIFLLLAFCLWAGTVFAALPNRIYSYKGKDKGGVMKVIRAHVKEERRIKINSVHQSVMVFARPEVHEKIAEELKDVNANALYVQMSVMYGDEAANVQLVNGGQSTLVLSTPPPKGLAQRAYPKIPPNRRVSAHGSPIPPRFSGLRMHASVLKQQLAFVRIRIEPVVCFGLVQTTEVVIFNEFATDILVKEEAFVDLNDAVKNSRILTEFLTVVRETEENDGSISTTEAPIPVILSLDGVTNKPVETESKKEAKQ